MDGLNRSGHTVTQEPLAVIRVHKLDVLQARHQRHRGSRRRKSIKRCPDRRVPDGMNLARDASVCGARNERRKLVRGLAEDAQLQGAFARLEKSGRLRPESPVGEQLEPANSSPAIRILTEQRAASKAPLNRSIEALWPQARMDAHGQAARIGHSGIRVEGKQVHIWRDIARIVHCHYAQLEHLSPETLQGAVERCQVRWWYAAHDQGARVLQNDTRRSSIISATDHPASRIRARGIEPGDDKRRRTPPHRVVVEGPDRRRSPRERRIEVRGGRPAAPSSLIPSSTLEPRSGRQCAVRGNQQGHPLLKGPRLRQVDLFRGEGRVQIVDVGVGQTWDRNFTGLEVDPDGVGIGAGLQVNRTAGERDAPVPDPDGLNPSETDRPGKRCNSANHQHVERHVRP